MLSNTLNWSEVFQRYKDALDRMIYFGQLCDAANVYIEPLDPSETSLCLLLSSHEDHFLRAKVEFVNNQFYVSNLDTGKEFSFFGPQDALDCVLKILAERQTP